MSLHINASKEAIADTVLLPGDPLRAKWIAETFLQDPVCYTNVRGMYGYTGTFNGKPISVQGTGMGIPSTLIYCHELITHYNVKNLVRVGSAGSYQKDINLRDIVIAMSASTTSSINSNRFPSNANYAPTANFQLFNNAIKYAQKQNISFSAGNVLSADIFYEDDFDIYKKWSSMGVLCVEMETAGLYSISAKHNVRALSILTISDSLVTGEQTTAQERESSFHPMVEMALNLVQDNLL